MEKEPNYTAWSIVGFIALCGLTAGGMIGCPHYTVYRQRLEGAALLAQLAHAQSAGESLKGNEAYLRYLWIIDVAGAGTDKTVVYIPTEANMPILEAARFLKAK